jgi:hypothetical protein
MIEREDIWKDLFNIKELRPEYDFHDSKNYIVYGLLESMIYIALIAERNINLILL